MEFKEIVKDAYYYDKTGMLLHGDCLKWMEKFPDKSVDMVLADLPYGTTKCKWDIIIPFDKLWKQYEKIITDKGNIVLFASQPFTSLLITSNLKLYKYSWVWNKVRGVGHLNAKKRPMMATEDICVFYKKIGIYNPQMREREKPRKSKNKSTQEVYGKTQYIFEGETLEKKYPINLITFSKSNQKDFLLHPTQKPVDLLEYLINTYTNENMVILDNAAGSCTTAIAARNLNRKWICIEKELKYCDISVERLKKQPI